MKFQVGQLLITAGAQAAVPRAEVQAALNRHIVGDWGTVCDEDAGQNDWSVENGARILSSYQTNDGVMFWIITEADRSSTTILLPSEY